ncbi:MAG TPA: S46 family peptidase, partial [Bacteroidales bacterium]|nr:S46 family peptidase [Bacteroidales bacterium]
MKKLTLIAILVAMFGIPSREEEGMWIPMLLGQLNARHMQDLGLKLNADDIYSVNHSSLKDAIVQFGGGCTGVIVSGEGLLLTNHHCGLSAIQRLSSLDHDYLSDGFWAASFEQELPCQGLSVTRLVRMEDVTARVLEGVTDQMNLFQREQVIRLHVSILEKSASENGRFETRVRPFFYGNQYYLFVNEVFKDIRLVGAPPAGIGKFGGDTDNWMWPRHTGDFSVFRIYTSKDGTPSPYSSGNVPYRPARFLPVSLKGYREGDFTFIFGYPGTTKEYLTSYGVDLVANQENPIKVALRGKRLDIIKAAMESDRLVRIQYAAKANGIANYWKKMMGESSGIRRIDALTTKREYETRFRMWAAGEEARRSRYGEVLDALQKSYAELLSPDRVSIYLQEAGQGIELVRFAAGFRTLAEVCRKQPAVADDVDKALQSLKRSAGEFYRNYQPEVDCRIMAEMLEELITNLSGHDRPPVLESMAGKNHEDIQAYSHRIFRESMFADSIRLYRFLDEFQANRVTRMEKDPAYRLMTGIYEFQEKEVAPAVTRITRQIDSLQR